MEKEIVEYKVVTGVSVYGDDFLQDVTKAIAEGWQPLGGVSITDDYYAQAMVKYKKQ